MQGYRIEESGRWGGRLTSRPLPDRDETIDALSDDERARLAEVWMGRAATERRVADSFAVILEALRAVGVDGDATLLAHRAIDDEHRHAEICRYVASRYHGSELAPAPLLPLAVPKLAKAPEALRHTLHIVGQCVLNETTAGAFLEACVHGADAPLARAALRELLSDEIDHARIGWMHLATVDDGTRAEVGRWMPALARANLRAWRESPRPYVPSAVYTAHGAPTAAEIEESLRSSVADLLIPGLKRVGVATGALETWLAAGAPSAASPVDQ
jgi:hypothetical protein